MLLSSALAPNLTVRVTEGTGRVYISTSPATEIDAQGAALIAAFTAGMLLSVDPARHDFYYNSRVAKHNSRRA